MIFYDILKPHQGYLFRVKFHHPGLHYSLSFQSGLTSEFALFTLMRIFSLIMKTFLQPRTYIIGKMFLTLNFIISCLCNLVYPANSLFTLMSFFSLIMRNPFNIVYFRFFAFSLMSLQLVIIEGFQGSVILRTSVEQTSFLLWDRFSASSSCSWVSLHL